MASKKEKTFQKRTINAQNVFGASQIGTLLGTIGSGALASLISKKYLDKFPGIPLNYEKRDIKNLKSHFSNKSSNTDILHSVDKILEKALDKNKNKRVNPELKEIGDLGESFIKKHKLREKGVKFNAESFSRLGDYYNPIKNTVNLKTGIPDVALHEMGHAADIKGSIPKTILRHSPRLLAALSIPAALAYGHQIKEEIPGTVDDKVVDFIQKNPVSIGAAAYGLSTLYPEAKASYLALKHIKDMRGSAAWKNAFKRSLGPAFATYLTGLLPIAAGYGLAKLVSHSQEKGLKKKAAMSPGMKAFLVGGLSTGIPIGLATRYYYGDRGGKTMRKMDEANAERNLKANFGNSAGKEMVKGRKRFNESLSKYPNATAIGAGTLAGAIVGGLTAAQMSDMDIFKKGVKKVLRK